MTVMISRLIGRLLALLRRDKMDIELDEELRYHLSRLADQYVAEGFSPDQARLMALREFGGLEQSRELCYEARGVRLIENLREDFRLGWLRLRKNPVFTAVAILALSLGIGANTTLFTLVNSMMFRSLPVTSPRQIYRMGDGLDWHDAFGIQERLSLYSYSLYQHLRDSTSEFTELAAFQPNLSYLGVRRSGDDQSSPFRGEFVSGNYFRMLGVGVCAGRTLTPADDQPEAQPVALISYQAWQQGYNRDQTLIGSTVFINTQSVRVIGVAPPGFFGETLRDKLPDFWLPLALEPALNPSNSRINNPDLYWLYVIGRLQTEVQPVQLQARLTAEIRRWLLAQQAVSDEDRSQIAKVYVVLTPAGGGINLLALKNKGMFRLLAALSGLVLLITCTTIAGLLLARGAAGQTQLAVRATLGATRARLSWQVLTESVLLALLGGVGGLWVAFEGARAFLSLEFRGASYLPVDLSPSLSVLLFTCLLSLLIGVISGIPPSWLALRARPIEIMRGAGCSAMARFGLSQKSLVVLQSALSLVLLIGAGLLVRTLHQLENQSFGFETENRLIVQVDPALAGYTPDRLAALYRQLQDRLKHIRGVQSASLSLSEPMGQNILYFEPSRIIDKDFHPTETDTYKWTMTNRVSAQYFETLGTHLLRGRTIDERDISTSNYVAVINEDFARKYLFGEEPLGKHINLPGFSGRTGDYEIVGVVEDTQYVDQRVLPVGAALFLPLLQPADSVDQDWSSFRTTENYIHSIQLHTFEHTDTLEGTVRRTLAEIDPNLAVLSVKSFDNQVISNFIDERLVADITTLYGLLVLFLSAIGLYGVVSYSGARRMKEVGIRLALGAERPNLIFLVLREALMPIAIGLVIGIPAAVAGGQAIAGHLYGVKSYDPIVFTIAVLVLAASATLASVIPALRTTFIDPVRALNTE